MRCQVNFRRIFCIVLTAALLGTGCRSVDETSPDMPQVSVITPAAVTAVAEQASEERENKETATEMLSAESETTEKTEIHTETEPVSPETAPVQTEAETTEKTTAASSAETEKITETSVTERLTLQQESPPETFSFTSQTAAQTGTEPLFPETEDVSVYVNYGANSYSAMNFREQKGFWITYLEYMSMMKNKSASSFRKSVSEAFDNIADLGFNTVYVQVRAFGDAYYDSALFPSGEQFDGRIGTENSFDALKIMVECAHERGLSIHAWVNPMRLTTTSQMEGISGNYPIKKWYDGKNGTYIVKSGDKWYLNPAYDEVTDLIAAGVTEIVSNYNVDGIQIDDYFYPTTDKSFDSAAYSASGTELSLSEWRMQNVNKMVKKLYRAVHNANSTAVFGISPQGNIQNNYSQLYADVRTWCAQSGYCDYILPQVYFGFEHKSQPYGSVISDWNSMAKGSGVKLVIGLAAYKIGETDTWAGAGKNEWTENSDVIARQIAAAKELSGYGGVAIYRYESLFAPSSSVAKQVNKEIKNIQT